MRTALLLAALQGAAARGGKGCEGDGGCGKALVNPCIDPSSNQSKLLWCDHTQPISARAKDAVSHLTQAEKICSLDTGGCANPSLGLPDYNWWSEASSGVGNHAHAATKFAYPITTGMSFNKTMWAAVGHAIGHEARALMNAGLAQSSFWAPVVNLAREPRWGRNIEVPGEDPYESGEYARYFVKGFQEAPEDPEHIQASACCKHYVANSMESTKESDGESFTRHTIDATIPMQDLVDSYMAPFQTCVEQGEVTSLMCSYNAVNGYPSCANHWLLQEVARDAWGFDGYITSDCGAENDVVKNHHFDNNTAAVRDILHAGTDADCGGFMGGNAAAALAAGLITEADIDTRLEMLFKVRIRLGHFDPVGPLQNFPLSDVCAPEHMELAFDGVAQSAAMLKNEGKTLPLTKGTNVAVIGPQANMSQSTFGYYGPSKPCDGKYWDLTDAIKKYGGEVRSHHGIPSGDSTDTSGIPAAVEMAAAADQVVLALGVDLSWAHEGHDSTTLEIPDAQMSLVTQTTAAAKVPVTVVFFCANPLDISALLANPKIGAIIHVGQPSTTIYGIAEVLFGMKSPAGRTIQTIYPASYADEISIFDFNMRPGPSSYARPDCKSKPCKKGTNPGRTHRFYTGKAVVPFGFGLSYSTFSYRITSAPTARVSLDPVRGLLDGAETEVARQFPSQKGIAMLLEADAPISYVVNVTNTGTMDADHVVLGMIKPPGAGTDGVPLQTLWGFERVFVKAGQTVTVDMYPSMTDFTQVDANGARNVHAGTYTVHFGIESMPRDQGFAQHSFEAQ